MVGPEAGRIDVWPWRARFATTRSGAAALIETGTVRLTHQGRQSRLDKPSRVVCPGDRLMFVTDGLVIDLEVLAVGRRRGPPQEARSLYRPVSP